jgi:HSP20 family protein
MGNDYKGFGFGASLEDIIQAAREFGEKMKEMGPEMGSFGFDSCFRHAFDRGPEGRHDHDRQRFYPFPPANVYTTRDGSLVLEFALAGIDEGSVSIAFQGDYLILSAKASAQAADADSGEFYRHGFRPRDVERQKYRVPAEDYLQEQAKATFRNGVLAVTVPPKASEGEGIKIEIVKEGN